MTRNLTCIGCPMGCQLTATVENGAVVSVSGNTCKRGEDYARKECVAPMRTVTGTVRLIDGREFLEALVAGDDEKVVLTGQNLGKLFGSFQLVLGIVFQLITFLMFLPAAKPGTGKAGGCPDCFAGEMQENFM